MAGMKRDCKKVKGVLAVAVMLCSLYGCGNRDDADQPANMVEITMAEADDTRTDTVQTKDRQETEAQPIVHDVPQDTQSGEDLDVVVPDPADDEWYKEENIYTDDNGRKLEVFFDDEGMLEFAVDGLSLYYTTVDDFQLENNWKIYTCNDGTVIIYYPGDPAHLEISDGEYAGLYEAGSDKIK